MIALARTDRPETVAAAQPLWDALAEAGKALSVTDLLCRTTVNRGAAENRLRHWSRGGYIIRIPGRPVRYAMPPQAASTPPSVTADGVVARRVPDRERLWLAMRVLKRFDFPALQITAEAEQASARAYVVQLVRSGHLRVARTGNGRTGEQATYVLVQNTGRQAPRPVSRTVNRRRTTTLHDDNTGQTFDVTAPARKRGEG